MDLCKDFECIIFDFDGTLVDSFDAWRNVDRIFMERRSLPIPEGFYDKVSSMNFRQAADYVIAECGVTDTPEYVMNEWLELIRREYSEVIEPVKGAKEFLHVLKENGVKLALATASRRELYEPCLKRHGIYHLFDAFVTTDEVERKKGFPDVYLLAAKKLGVSPKNCCVFEDNSTGAKGAKAAGMRCVGVLEKNTPYDWNELRRTADMVISDYTKMI